MALINVVYDDRIKPDKGVAAINGGRCFGDTVYRRKTLFARCARLVPHLIRLTAEGFTADLVKGRAVCHIFASYIIADEAEFEILMTKALYAKEIYQVVSEKDKNPAMLIFPDPESYRDYIERGIMKKPAAVISEAFKGINDTEGFISYITGGFDARFFNSLEGDFYTVVKSSSNIKKLKKEHDYYYLLPDSMKHYFVQPYNYREENGRAYYTMERCHMTDIAIRYVHGAIDDEELSDILEDLFEFIKKREKKAVSFEAYTRLRDELYLNKLRTRIDELKNAKDYNLLAGYIKSGTAYGDIDEIFKEYEAAYNRLIVEKDMKSRDKEHFAAISHGDLCFSNILYHKDARLLKLIDVKGANVEEELYLDEYYDIAKLSHSICGLYDFFNAAMYDISLDEDMRIVLNIDKSNEAEKEIFAAFLADNGFDYKRVRLYEASLFLSMLPLHMDNPKKVMGFVLNAVNILAEI